MSKDILERLDDKYGQGEWVIEKGKVREAKLLREAYGSIKTLRAEKDRLVNNAVDNWKTERRLVSRVEELERELASEKAATKRFLKRIQHYIEKQS